MEYTIKSMGPFIIDIDGIGCNVKCKLIYSDGCIDSYILESYNPIYLKYIVVINDIENNNKGIFYDVIKTRNNLYIMDCKWAKNTITLKKNMTNIFTGVQSNKIHKLLVNRIDKCCYCSQKKYFKNSCYIKVTTNNIFNIIDCFCIGVYNEFDDCIYLVLIYEYKQIMLKFSPDLTELYQCEIPNGLYSALKRCNIEYDETGRIYYRTNKNKIVYVDNFEFVSKLTPKVYN